MFEVTAAMHASMAIGCTCVTCAESHLPCPTCYAAWWPSRLTGPSGSATRQFNDQRKAAISQLEPLRTV